MILVDTSIWVDYFRKGDAELAGALEQGRVLMHPFVLGEIACGSLSQRSALLELLQDLPCAVLAELDEVLGFIHQKRLHGIGIGYIDVHLLASVTLTQNTRLWTRDKRLDATAEKLNLAFRPEAH